MRIKLLSTKSIIVDEEYRITYPILYDSLKKSIKEVGLVEPPKVFLNGESYFLLTGYRRFQTLLELNIKKANFLVLEKEFSPEERLEQTLFENITKRELTFYEKFIFLKKMIKLSKEKFINYLKILGLKELQEENFLRDYSEKTHLLMEKNKLNPKSLFMVKYLKSDEDEKLFSFFYENNFTHSEIREAISLYLRVKEMGKEFSIENKNKEDFFEELRDIVYPSVRKLEERLNDLRKRFKGIKIESYPFFEKRKLKFSLEFESYEELRKKLKKALKSLEGLEGNFFEE